MLVDRAPASPARGERRVDRAPGRRRRPGHGSKSSPLFSDGGRVVRGAVVGEHVALEAPLAARGSSWSRWSFSQAYCAVEPVVGAHHRADVRLLDRRLELRQVDLAQRALVDDRVDESCGCPRRPAARAAARAAGVGRRRVALLVVGREVLDVGDHALRLRAAGSSRPPCARRGTGPRRRPRTCGRRAACA